MIKFEDGRFYIGSRKSKVPAEDDVNYWGSPGKINKPFWDLKKEKHILFESTDISLQDLREKERTLIEAGWKKFGKDKCVNKTLGGLSYITDEVHKKKIEKQRREKTGAVFGSTKEELSEWGKKSGRMHVERGTGLFSMSDEEKKRVQIKGGKSAGKLTYKLGIGIHSLTKEQRQEIGKRNMEQKKGFFGWSREKVLENIYDAGKKRWRSYKLISPEGEIFSGKCLSHFCEEMGLNRKCMSRVVLGERKSHKGWTRA